MNINIAATAQNDFNVSGATLCRTRGDFDATVDFNLPTWPTGHGIWVMLQLTGSPFEVYRVTWQFQPNEAYGAFFPPAGTSLPATGTNGTLRLSRRGDIFTGYYRNGLSWFRSSAALDQLTMQVSHSESRTTRVYHRSLGYRRRSRSTTSTCSPTGSSVSD
jgi:hypothetical protein